MTDNQAKEVVSNFLGDARREMERRMELALYKIARMNWWQRLWYASDVADECLGVGKYWDKEWKNK